eukprot:Platyproteum_vivax@DN7484_c0_g1_i7.p1
MSTTVGRSLQTPYVLVGLPATSNYIDDFYMGLANGHLVWSNRWVSLIPNTQVFAFPYPSRLPKDWKIELSVNPGTKFVWILLATVVCLLVVGAVIFILDRREKMEDSQMQQTFRVHFIAT